MNTLYKKVNPNELPPRRKEISDYSILVIGVFSDTLVDMIHYNYHKKEWSFSDGDKLGPLKLQYWLKPIETPNMEDIVNASIEDYKNQTKWDNAYDRKKGFINGAKFIISNQ